MFEKLKQFHQLQESLNRFEIKIDLNKLSYAKETLYNFYEDDHIICHFVIRVDLFHKIYDWTQDFHNKSVFWLNDWTIERTSTNRRFLELWLND